MSTAGSKHSMNFTPPSLSAQRASIFLVSLMSLLHLFLAFHVELGGDEAHYALYGLMPDWSYFDHPPMVGWLQILPMWLAPYDWSARIVPIALYALLNYVLYQLTIELFCKQSSNSNWQHRQPAHDTNHWLGFWTLAVLNSCLILVLMGMAMLPDNLLMVVTLALILTVIKLLETNAFKYWIILGVLVGLAALSKYTAVTLVVSLLLVMLVEKRWIWLAQKGLWLAILIAILMITPVLYWNAQNDWASFLYQIDHGTGSAVWELDSLVRTQLVQLASYTPVIFILGWWMMLKPAHYRDARTRLLLLFALPITALFAWGSGFEESLPHWVSLSWLLLIPIIVHWAWQLRDKKWLKPLAYFHFILAGSLVLLAHSLLYKPWIPFDDHKNPIQGDYGWPQAAKTALELQKNLTDDPKTLPLFVSNWSVTSHLAWYARPQPVFITSKKQTQYAFWFGLPHAGTNGLLVVPHYEKTPPKTQKPAHFERCERLKEEPLSVNGAIVVTYYYYHCFNFTPPLPASDETP
ncbi:MAG: glycosyltransferase family 39 protein [Thiomicrorhabdus sp.]|nr:glycosyltransferase family 39 protein [Thiomicrorhabdus sp.]